MLSIRPDGPSYLAFFELPTKSRSVMIGKSKGKFVSGTVSLSLSLSFSANRVTFRVCGGV